MIRYDDDDDDDGSLTRSLFKYIYIVLSSFTRFYTREYNIIIFYCIRMYTHTPQVLSRFFERTLVLDEGFVVEIKIIIINKRKIHAYKFNRLYVQVFHNITLLKETFLNINRICIL